MKLSEAGSVGTTTTLSSPKPLRLLNMRINRFGDVEIDSRDLDQDLVTFKKRLSSSLSQWRNDKRPGVWLLIPLHRASLIPTSIRLGFAPHHSTSTYFMMTTWLPHSPSKLPNIGTNNVGVSVLVPRFRNGRAEVIMVREKYAKRKDTWKAISGGVELGEHITDAAVRELREEVGVRGTFESIVGLWNRKNAKFHRGELHVACVVRQQHQQYVQQQQQQQRNRGHGSDQFLLQRDEIVGARWVDMVEAFRLASQDARDIERHWLCSMIGSMFRTPCIKELIEASPANKGLSLVETNDVRGPPQRMHFHVYSWIPELFNSVGAASSSILEQWMKEAVHAPWYEEWNYDPPPVPPQARDTTTTDEACRSPSQSPPPSPDRPREE